ncbi:MAG TPA: iron ABC transporter permease [Bacillota bacterium]|nr:iron ABC transporter permease [Bacillota bacterium]
MKKLSFPSQLFFALGVFILMFFVAMSFGAADVSFKDVWLALTSSAANDNIAIIRDIRLPREIAAIFVGAGLSVSGAIMQGMTRNPLADPGLFGLSAGAYAALAVTIVFFPAANYFWTMVAALVGAFLGALFVFGIGSAVKGGFSPTRIVLAGAAVSTFLYAVGEGVGLYFKVSKDISMWTAGGMAGANWKQLQVIVPVIILGIVLSFFLARQLTILSLSEEVATSLGQNIFIVKVVLFIIIIVLSGASVALVGNMTFIGLMIPHIVRALVGTDYRFILPMSAIVGAIFMLFADTLGRTLNAPYETPVAAIVAIIGLPFFLTIVRKGGRALS